MVKAEDVVVKFVDKESPYFLAMVELMKEELKRKGESENPSRGKYVVKISDGFTTGAYTLEGGRGEYSIADLISFIVGNTPLKIISHKMEPKFFDFMEQE